MDDDGQAVPGDDDLEEVRSSPLSSREDMPIWQAPALQAWMPALDPPPWTSTPRPGLFSMKTSAHLSAKGWMLVEPASVSSVAERSGGRPGPRRRRGQEKS